MSNSAKRKHCHPNDDLPASQEKARVDNDAEVDEFFAILRRIRVAVNYFKERNADGRKFGETGELERETNGNEGNGVKGNGKREQAVGVEKHSGLDLNANPEPEDDLA